jgi:hypothetical protein
MWTVSKLSHPVNEVDRRKDLLIFTAAKFRRVDPNFKVIQILMPFLLQDLFVICLHRVLVVTTRCHYKSKIVCKFAKLFPILLLSCATYFPELRNVLMLYEKFNLAASVEFECSFKQLSQQLNNYSTTLEIK